MGCMIDNVFFQPSWLNEMLTKTISGLDKCTPRWFVVTCGSIWKDEPTLETR